MTKISELVQRKEREENERLQARKAARERIPGLIDERTQAIARSDEAFEAYLRMQAKHPQFSATNAIAILAQWPDATDVRLYDTWKKLGRHVLAAEKCRVRIYKGNPRTGSYDLAPAFDLSQTGGKAPPGEVLLREGSAQMDKALQSLAAQCPVSIVTQKDGPQDAREPYRPEEKTLYLREDLTDCAAFRLLAQGIVQARMHCQRPHDRQTDFAEEAAVASALLCLRFGVDAPPPALAGLSALYRDMEARDIRKHLNAIRSVAERMGAQITRSIAPPTRARQETR